MLTIRELDPATDLAAVSGLLSVPVERLRQVMRLPVEVRQLAVAVKDQDRLVGYCALFRSSMAPDGEFSLWLVVHHAHRHQGIATRLYVEALRSAQTRGATDLAGRVPDDAPAGLAFARKHGFVIARHQIGSRLKLAAFDEAPFVGGLAQVKASGIRFTTLAVEGDTPENRTRLYELNRLTAMDIPGRGPFPGFDAYNHGRLGGDGYRADGVILAKHCDLWVGFTQVTVHPEGDFMFNEMTGVRDAYRGQKIAQALKLLAVRCAQGYQVAAVRTINDAENAPIMAINRRMGYQHEFGFYTVRQQLKHKAGPSAVIQ